MSTSTRKRLQQLITFLLHHPDGMTTPEIADYFNISRQTAHKDIQRLEADGVPIRVEGTRYFIDPTYYHRVQLTLPQAWFMYLPLRRIVRAGLHHDPLIAELLYKIIALLHDDLADQLISDKTGEMPSEAPQVFEKLVQCWSELCHADITYLKPNATEPTRMVVAPWWFEPAVWSDAFYMIAGLQTNREDAVPITLKIDRIKSVKILDSSFQRPDSKEIMQYLENTWGIWVGNNNEPTLVKLRFHNRQYDRLRETRWHPDEQITLDENGRVIWQAHISEPQEMLPWIRGWGADVEVLEPQPIREQVALDAEATARMYGHDPDEKRSFF